MEDKDIVPRAESEPQSTIPQSSQPPAPAVPVGFDLYESGRRLLILVVALLAGVWLLRELSGVVLLFAVVVLAAMALNGPVSALERRGFKRAPVAGLLVAGLLLAGGLGAWLMAPPLLREANALVAQVPAYEASIKRQSSDLLEQYPFIRRALPAEEQWASTVRTQVGAAVRWLLRSTFSAVGALAGLFVAILLLVFVLGQPRPLVAGLLRLVPERHRGPTRRSVSRFMHQVTVWVKSTLLMGAITGVSTGVLLYFLGVQPALIFGVLAFGGEFVPNIGPLVASLPALLVALGHGPDTALWTLAAILFVQQIETNILVPLIMGRQMEMHPATITFFALSMGALLGIVGAVLAVPIAALVNILVDEFYLRPRRLDEALIQSQTADILHGQSNEAGHGGG